MAWQVAGPVLHWTTLPTTRLDFDDLMTAKVHFQSRKARCITESFQACSCVAVNEQRMKGSFLKRLWWRVGGEVRRFERYPFARASSSLQDGKLNLTYLFITKF